MSLLEEDNSNAIIRYESCDWLELFVIEFTGHCKRGD
jgi:hypothetical protein